MVQKLMLRDPKRGQLSHQINSQLINHRVLEYQLTNFQQNYYLKILRIFSKLAFSGFHICLCELELKSGPQGSSLGQRSTDHPVKGQTGSSRSKILKFFVSLGPVRDLQSLFGPGLSRS